MTGKGDASGLLTRDFTRVTLANFFFFLTFASFFLLPLRVRELGGSERTVGFVMGTNGIAGLVGVFLLGPLLDRFDRRLFLRGGIALMMLCTFGFRYVDAIGPGIYLLRVLQGIAFAAGFNAASTLAAELAPVGRRAAALGIFGVSTLGTHAIAPTIGEQLVRLGGFSLLFLVATGYSVVALALTVSLPETGSRSRGAAEPLELDGGAVRTFAVVLLTGVAFGTVVTFTPTFVHDAGLGSVSTFFLSYTVAAIATRFRGAGIGDRLGHRRVIGPAIAVLGGSIAALATVHSAAGLAAVGVVFGAAQGVMYPTLNAYVIEHATTGNLGRLQTLFNGSFNLGVTSGSLALGIVADAFGHRVLFLCAAATAGAALVLFRAGAPPAPYDPSALDRAGRANG